MDQHAHWMRNAVDEARAAGRDGEAPIAALVVQDGRIVGKGRNTKTSQNCGYAHAELNAILDAGPKLGRRPAGAVLYCTLEPCAMCLGAVIFSGIRTLVYGAEDPEAGAVETLRRDERYAKWMPEVIPSILREECQALNSLPTMMSRKA